MRQECTNRESNPLTPWQKAPERARRNIYLKWHLHLKTGSEIRASARRHHRFCKLKGHFYIQCEFYFCFIFSYLFSVTFLGQHRKKTALGRFIFIFFCISCVFDQLFQGAPAPACSWGTGMVQSSFPRAWGWSLSSAGRAVSIGILVAPGACISPDPTVLPTALLYGHQHS